SATSRRTCSIASPAGFFPVMAAHPTRAGIETARENRLRSVKHRTASRHGASGLVSSALALGNGILPPPVFRHLQLVPVAGECALTCEVVPRLYTRLFALVVDVREAEEPEDRRLVGGPQTLRVPEP